MLLRKSATAITGSAAAIATALTSSGITDAASIVATIDAGSAAAADINNINTNSTQCCSNAVTDSTGNLQQTYNQILKQWNYWPWLNELHCFRKYNCLQPLQV